MEITNLTQDVVAEDQGEERALPSFPGMFVTVRSTNYEPYRRGLARAMRPLQKAFRANGADPVLVEQINAQQLPKHLVIAVRGVTENGEPMGIKRFREVLGQREYRRLFDEVAEECAEVGRRENQDVEDAVGNSEGESDTP